MRTETKAALALTAGARLRSALLAGLAVIVLASCGGGEGDESPSPNIGWIRIDSTSTPPGSTGEGFSTLEGMTFSGATNVSWINETTGESGQASHQVEEFGDCFIGFCLFEFVHIWNARVRVVMGANMIRVSASDGAGNFGTDEIIVTRQLDVTPPTIKSMHPRNGSTAVPLNNSGIYVVFSEAMDVATITSETVFLKDHFGQRVAAPKSLLGNIVFLNPNVHLNAFTTYTVTVTNGVQDLAGNALTASHSWAFTTGDNVGGFNNPLSPFQFP